MNAASSYVYFMLALYFPKSNEIVCGNVGIKASAFCESNFSPNEKKHSAGTIIVGVYLK